MADAMRMPPYSAEAENIVLSSMLLDDEGLSYGVTELTADMFYRPDNRVVFQAMNGLFVSNKPVGLVTLIEWLRESQLFEKVGGLQRIAEISEATYTSTHIKHHAAIVKEYYNRRKTIAYAQGLIKTAYSGKFTELQNMLSDIPGFEQAVKDKSTGVLLQEAVTRVQERHNEPEKNRIGLLTGLPDLDYHVGGLRKKDVIFLTAEPNVGKSLLALQICLKTAADGLCAAYFNFEMSEEYIGDRILSMALPMDAKAIHTPSAFLTHEDLELINSTDIDKHLDKTLFIYTNAVPTLQTIMSKCKLLRVKGKSPDVIAVDYLQLMDADGRSQMEKVENISLGLKRIANEFNCPVFVISSLSKDSKMRHSYQLHFDADVILYMRTDGKLEEGSRDRDIKPVNVEIQKNRKGRVGGVVDLALSLKFLKFRGVPKNEHRNKR